MDSVNTVTDANTCTNFPKAQRKIQKLAATVNNRTVLQVQWNADHNSQAKKSNNSNTEPALKCSNKKISSFSKCIFVFM
jgi:hypothetical protein